MKVFFRYLSILLLVVGLVFVLNFRYRLWRRDGGDIGSGVMTTQEEIQKDLSGDGDGSGGGEDESSEVVEHNPVESGIGDSGVYGFAVVSGVIGMLALLGYKLSYRLYVFD